MKVSTENHNNFGYEKITIVALLRNNKQHVVLGQRRKCQRLEESGL
jgi:hypothetical protein